MNGSRLSLSRLSVVAVLFVLGIALVLSKDQAKSIVRIVLESNWPPILIWLMAIIGVGADRFFREKLGSSSSGFIYQSFGDYADSVFTIATYGLSGSTSLALLKGLYLQLFFDGAFFTGFGEFDLASIFVISSFLLFYAVIGTTKQLANVVFNVEATKVTAS